MEIIAEHGHILRLEIGDLEDFCEIGLFDFFCDLDLASFYSALFLSDLENYANSDSSCLTLNTIFFYLFVYDFNRSEDESSALPTYSWILYSISYKYLVFSSVPNPVAYPADLFGTPLLSLSSSSKNFSLFSCIASKQSSVNLVAIISADFASDLAYTTSFSRSDYSFRTSLYTSSWDGFKSILSSISFTCSSTLTSHWLSADSIFYISALLADLLPFDLLLLEPLESVS